MADDPACLAMLEVRMMAMWANPRMGVGPTGQASVALIPSSLPALRLPERGGSRHELGADLCTAQVATDLGHWAAGVRVAAPRLAAIRNLHDALLVRDHIMLKHDHAFALIPKIGQEL